MTAAKPSEAIRRAAEDRSDELIANGAGVSPIGVVALVQSCQYHALLDYIDALEERLRKLEAKP